MAAGPPKLTQRLDDRSILFRRIACDLQGDFVIIRVRCEGDGLIRPFGHQHAVAAFEAEAGQQLFGQDEAGRVAELLNFEARGWLQSLCYTKSITDNGPIFRPLSA